MGDDNNVSSCEEQGMDTSGSWHDAKGGEGGSGERKLGKCKWFNVVKGYGFITPHDGSQDVFVHQTVIQMSGFRSLGEGEDVEFEARPSDKGVEATLVTGPGGSDCRGSERRPVSRKKFRKIRCYNCGDFANHIAAKCPHGPLPKRCHYCKAEDHLIAECPSRKGDVDTGTSNGDDSGTGPGDSGSSGREDEDDFSQEQQHQNVSAES